MMKKIAYTFLVLCMAVPAWARNQGSGKNAQDERDIQSSETYTYTLPESFSTATKEEKEQKKDEKQREKLIEDIRKLYQANFI